jgi:hypothetical protein
MARVFARMLRGVAIVGRSVRETDGGAMMRSSRITRAALVMLTGAWMLAPSSASTKGAALTPVQAQAGWTFHLEWNHTGTLANYYQLCVNDNVPCTVLSDAQNAEGDIWRAAMPMLPPGEYRLVLQACRFEGCVAGQPDLMIRVSAPSPDSPPIDVIEHPADPAPH